MTYTILRPSFFIEAVLELGGEAVSPNEVVREVERRSGRPMSVERIPADALQAQRARATDPMEHTFATFMLGYAQGDDMDVGSTETLDLSIRSVRDVFPR